MFSQLYSPLHGCFQHPFHFVPSTSLSDLEDARPGWITCEFLLLYTPFGIKPRTAEEAVEMSSIQQVEIDRWQKDGMLPRILFHIRVSVVYDMWREPREGVEGRRRIF